MRKKLVKKNTFWNTSWCYWNGNFNSFFPKLSQLTLMHILNINIEGPMLSVRTLVQGQVKKLQIFEYYFYVIFFWGGDNMVYCRITVSRDQVLPNKCLFWGATLLIWYMGRVQCGCNNKWWIRNVYKQSAVLLTGLSARYDQLAITVLAHYSSLILSKVPDPWYN